MKSSLFAVALFLGVARAQNGTGTLFWFTPGVGACGFNNTSDQYVASVSAAVFDGYPGATSNPNDNPICQHNLTVSYNGTNVTAQIVDYCPSCPDTNVGLSPIAFEEFANTTQGIVSGVYWIVD
ncbi:uncharacterized protein LAESUDRAFT_761482 [Laetiporus sulphureus 93-53]|uniref:RlpA-like protein double-psi beta-barrel domain-containing protein n=1 Tax=Laetiporus sulphureus 93-53 TaxID=1314785 RepID=A0A165D0C5_9APHY|nr:uncharacterized protein LAESUDRAFT_761482 [Laetiporus sulphureus 93-53]KZT03880.1 hypothetical protein LAESUDRAFT_761482 [Laetiporus sulphureus 93-53]